MEHLIAYLDDLGRSISIYGIERYEEQALRLANLSLRLGVAAAAASVLADRREPAVARERAFARVSAALRSPRVVTRLQIPA